MALKKCPKCYTNAYEHIASYSICHACNYHSEEGYLWGKCHDAKAYRHLIDLKLSLPFEQEEKEAFEKYFSSHFIFCAGDYEIARDALRKISPFRRAIVYLKFWKEYSNEELATLMCWETWQMNALLKNIFLQLKEECIKHPDFASYRLRAAIGSPLLLKAA